MSNDLAEKRNQIVDGSTAAIAVIIRDNAILLGLREYQEAPTVWTAPGGASEGSEKLEAVVRRETKEETGITDLKFIAYIGVVEAGGRDRLHIFHCETNQDPKLTEPDKFREWRWFDIDGFVVGEPENYINEPSRRVIMDYCKNNGIIQN